MSVTDEPKGTEVVEARDMTVELGGLPVIRGVDLRIRHGEAVALMGGNGSGKSTLVRSLLRLIPVQRGDVRLFGTPLVRFEDWPRVGYVPQRSATVLRTATVREVVASGRLARRKLFVPLKDIDRRAITTALSAVGIADRASHDLASLSGGQQQRVLIARALAGEPDLLVLDEPMAGVDLKSQRALAQLLTDLVAAGKSVLVVLHEVGVLSGLVDRAVVLHEGRIISDGPLELSGQAHVAGRHEHDEPAVDQGWLGGMVER